MRDRRDQKPSAPHKNPFFVLCLLLLVLSSYLMLLFLTTQGDAPSRQRGDHILFKSNIYPAEFLPPKPSHQFRSKANTTMRMQTLDPNPTPPQCGILFFYHIACTGGSSINRWLGKEKDANANVTYWTKWGRHDGVQDGFIRDMNGHVLSLGGHEWKIVHAHGYSFFPNTSEPYLTEWRRVVEGRGCRFFVATMLRDAIGHTISQNKGAIKGNLSVAEWLKHLEPANANQRGYWNTQIDYLLYNRGPRNEYNATKEEKVRRAIQLLLRHFDLVGYKNYDYFMNVILNVTGWERVPMRHSNSFSGELRYTEGELGMVKRLTEGNGDVMFIDAVRHIYHGHLDYLTEVSDDDGGSLQNPDQQNLKL